MCISIHALLAESDFALMTQKTLTVIFLSTLSLRRATYFSQRGFAASNFYPRSPCGERQSCCYRLPKSIRISIHALLAESDWFALIVTGGFTEFLSTLSLRRATPQHSIVAISSVDFYPRSPCGERRPGCSPGWCRSRISIHALLAESDKQA